jgi:hypothetical protein
VSGLNIDSITWNPLAFSSQVPFDVAVVVPTVLRASLGRAVRSIFRQQFEGRIQILIGIDQPQGDPSILSELASACPSRCSLTILRLGYSTSVRHGGLYSAQDGGALRTMLSFAANAKFVAYLDDDNWWGEDHLRSLMAAVQGKHWAFSFRWFVDEETLTPLAVDCWESVGPDAGVFVQPFGGFVDPSSLLIDKLACEDALPRWCRSLPTDGKGMSSDRVFFDAIRNRPFGASQLPTAYYVMHPSDVNHGFRLQAMGISATRGERSRPG